MIYITNKFFFIFNDKLYDYFDHPYNTTIQNERCIEIPIVRNYLAKYPEKRVLEVGNVLSHYYYCNHIIVDKYEIGEGVKNIDINEYFPEELFDIVVSISTIEHVSEEREVLLRTFEHLKSLLKPNGVLMITFPLGYNKCIDTMLADKCFKDFACYYMERIDKYYGWVQAEYNDIKDCKHCSPYPSGNGIVIMKWRK